MGLYSCITMAFCCSRRRRTSLVGIVTALVVLATVVCLLMHLVVENAHKDSVRRTLQWYTHTADYSSLYDNRSTADKNPHFMFSNSRLPKEVSTSDSTAAQEHELQQQQESDKEDKITMAALPDSNAKPNYATPSQNGPNSLELLRQEFLKHNREQRVLNADKFPPLTSDGLVLVVQVHRREGYLKQLLESLRQASDIEKTLLVISHDYYYDEINALVQSIDFCRVIQIFYPFALQLYPDTFPGESKNDCPRDSPRQVAEAKNCTNAHHPDSFGHYREAPVTAIKHHWWWKINVVFDQLRETKNFTGYVLFLEEDHYVSPDFITTANQLAALKKENCADCDFLNLGMYSKIKSYQGIGNRVSIGIWNAGKNNMGFGMNRETWNQIKACSEHFCRYDDYNWDWSLNTLGKACLQRDLKVIVVKVPRIFHIGTCGVHHKKSCNEAAEAAVVRERLRAQKQNLFPETLHLDSGLNPAAPRKAIKNFGGWGDIRDHELCLSFVNTGT